MYFTLHFAKAVDRPLKALQDYLDHYKTLGGKDVFPDSLMLTGNYSAKVCCLSKQSLQ